MSLSSTIRCGDTEIDVEIFVDGSIEWDAEVLEEEETESMLTGEPTECVQLFGGVAEEPLEIFILPEITSQYLIGLIACEWVEMLSFFDSRCADKIGSHDTYFGRIAGLLDVVNILKYAFARAAAGGEPIMSSEEIDKYDLEIMELRKESVYYYTAGITAHSKAMIAVELLLKYFKIAFMKGWPEGGSVTEAWMVRDREMPWTARALVLEMTDQVVASWLYSDELDLPDKEVEPEMFERAFWIVKGFREGTLKL